MSKASVSFCQDNCDIRVFFVLKHSVDGAWEKCVDSINKFNRMKKIKEWLRLRLRFSRIGMHVCGG